MAGDDGREQPGGRTSEHGGDHPDHARDRQELLPASALQPLDPEPLCRWDTEEVVDQFGGVVEVVAAQPGDAPRLTVVHLLSDPGSVQGKRTSVSRMSSSRSAA
jgi:hypothetical protein